MNRHFSEEDKKMANKHARQYLLSLKTEETQSK